MSQRADPTIGITADGTIYATIHTRIFKSTDAGHTWSTIVVDPDVLQPPAGYTYDSFGVLRDGTLLWGYHYRITQDQYVTRSEDGAKTWSKSVKLDKQPFGRCGGNQSGLTELPDGAILYPTGIGPPIEHLIHVYEKGDAPYLGEPFYHTYVYRSTDRGRTWPQRSQIQPWSTETSIVALTSGKLVAALRYQRQGPPGSTVPEYEPPEMTRTDVGNRIVGKRVFLKDSTDTGRTWKNFRPVWRNIDGPIDLPFGDAHGQLVQLPDGRVLLTHEHRYPRQTCDIRARLSRDEAETWQPQIYHLSKGCGYGASGVTGDGTIVTVCGNTPLNPKTADTADGKWYAQVVRWRPEN